MKPYVYNVISKTTKPYVHKISRVHKLIHYQLMGKFKISCRVWLGQDAASPPRELQSHGNLAAASTCLKSPFLTHCRSFQGSHGAFSKCGRSPATQHKDGSNRSSTGTLIAFPMAALKLPLLILTVPHTSLNNDGGTPAAAASRPSV